MRVNRQHAIVSCLFAALLQCACELTTPEKGMNATTPTSSAEIEALKKAYAAFNRNDIPATVDALDPNIEWTEPTEFAGGGTYHGHEGVKAYLAQSRANWAEGSSEPERFLVAGDKIIVFVHVRVKLKDSTEWHEDRIADVFVFRNGKAFQMRAFANRQRALEWAGVKDGNVN
jgi:ketosteroid isomerase-like protein